MRALMTATGAVVPGIASTFQRLLYNLLTDPLLSMGFSPDGTGGSMNVPGGQYYLSFHGTGLQDDGDGTASGQVSDMTVASWATGKKKEIDFLTVISFGLLFDLRDLDEDDPSPSTASGFFDALDAGTGNGIRFDGSGEGDTCEGTGGNDLIRGAAGADWFIMGDGDDRFIGGRGGDTLDCSEAESTLTFDVAQGVVVHTGGSVFLRSVEALKGSTFNDNLDFSGAAFSPQKINSGIGDDTIIGSDRSERIRGSDGDDTLWGNGGDDIIRGGKGNDFIRGGAGDDTLTGGKGSDIFDFDMQNGPTDQGDDIVTDFVPGVDRIVINGPNGAGAGSVAFSYSGGDTIITYNAPGGASNQITVQGVTIIEADIEVNWF